jgi:hypothetical protein
MWAPNRVWEAFGSMFRPAARVGNGHEPGAEPDGRPASRSRLDAAGAPALPPVLSVTRRPGSIWRSKTPDRVLELMDAMQQHFEKQDRRAEELAESVNRVGEYLERLADAQRAQGDCIATIANQVSAAGRHTARLSETLADLPSSLSAQAQVARNIARQMESSQQTDRELTTSLQQFGTAVDALRESGTVQVQTLQKLHAAGQQQTDALQTFIKEQNRRFLIITIVAAGLGVGALLTIGLYLVLTLAR